MTKDEEIREVVRLRNEGYSIFAIRKKLGMTWYRVNLYLGNDEDRQKRLKKQKQDRESTDPKRRALRRLFVEKSRAKKNGYASVNADSKEVADKFTGKCHICNDENPTIMRGLVIDHCHTTGKFRGWLCGKCNTLLGMAKDNIEVLKKAIEYLENNK